MKMSKKGESYLYAQQLGRRPKNRICLHGGSQNACFILLFKSDEALREGK